MRRFPGYVHTSLPPCPRPRPRTRPLQVIDLEQYTIKDKPDKKHAFSLVGETPAVEGKTINLQASSDEEKVSLPVKKGHRQGWHWRSIISGPRALHHLRCLAQRAHAPQRFRMADGRRNGKRGVEGGHGGALSWWGPCCFPQRREGVWGQ